MKILKCEQRSQEWYQARKGKIGGTRLGQVISNRKNKLIYELINEQLSDHVFPDDYISDDMQFGIDNEEIARDLYSELSGISFEQIGMILSDYSGIHMASPDGINMNCGIVLEIKCTINGHIHIQRFFEGVESTHLPQIINYFAVSDEINEVHWVSYCPERTERPLIAFVYERSQFSEQIQNARALISEMENNVKSMIGKFIPPVETVSF